MTEGANCFYCLRPLDRNDRTTLQRVEGWERRQATRPGGARGGSDILHRQRQDAYAHDWCVDKERKGISARQEELF